MSRLFAGIAKAGVLAAALLLPGLSANATPYSEIYVFGDSLVDAGNATTLAPEAAPAELGYYNGRFTNGPLYTDLLYSARFGREMTNSLAGGSNYAFGMARAVDNSGFAIGGDAMPDLGQQVDVFAANHGGAAASDALYIVNVTGNDVFALMTGAINGMDPADYAALAASSLAAQIQRLNDMGARHILVTGVPNADIPEAFLLQAMVDDALAGLSLEAELMSYSYLDLFTRALADPASIGLSADTDFATPCLVARTPSPDIDCTGYFFFDQTHPTAALHQIVAREIGALVGITRVSEPGALALIGFGLAGAALARRRRP